MNEFRVFFRKFALFGLLFTAGPLCGAELRTGPGQPNIGDLYANSIRIDSSQRIVLPDGVWLVNNSFEDKQAGWHAAWRVITLVNQDLESPFPLVVLRYHSVSTSSWGTEPCEKKSNPHGFQYDTQGTKGNKSVCSNFFSFADPKLLFSSILPNTYKFHWARALEKLSSEFILQLAPGQVLLEATASKGGGLYIKQEILVDIGKLGLSAEILKQHGIGSDSVVAERISNWRRGYVKAMTQSFLDKIEVQPIEYALMSPKRQAAVNQLAQIGAENGTKPSARDNVQSSNESNASNETQDLKATEELAKREEELARSRAQTLAKEREEERRRTDLLAKESDEAKRKAEILAREKEEAKRRAEMLAKENEESRRQAELLLKEKEDARQRAEKIAKENEEARRLAEARAKAIEEAAAQEAALKEAALKEANRKIEQLAERNQAASKPTQASEKNSKRKALLIGNDGYQSVPSLKNARTDARAMGHALAKLGYKVWVKTDLNRKDMQAAIRQFRSEVQGGDEVVIFYAGHAVQIASANYLLPTDIAGASEDEVKDEAIQLQRLLEDMGERKTQITLALIDACRDNPFQKNGRNIGGRGLAPTTAATGQMIIFSAGAGQQALDRLSNDDRDPNGLFTRIFIQEMKTPGIRIDNLAREVRKKVVEAAKSVGHDQVPAIYDQVVGDFYFSQ